VDIDYLGGMFIIKKEATKAKGKPKTTSESEPEEVGDDPKDEKGETNARTSRLSFSTSISLDPYHDTVLSRFASAGASPCAVTDKAKTTNSRPQPTPYSNQYHATRYQFPFSLEMDSLLNPDKVPDVVEMVCNLYKVGGNHARFFFDYSAESVFLRLTHNPAHRMTFCFEHDERKNVLAPGVLSRVESGDIPADGLFVGGLIAATELGEALRSHGAVVERSVDKMLGVMRERLAGM
jgi:CRISPR-associated protein Cst2